MREPILTAINVAKHSVLIDADSAAVCKLVSAVPSCAFRIRLSFETVAVGGLSGYRVLLQERRCDGYERLSSQAWGVRVSWIVR